MVSERGSCSHLNVTVLRPQDVGWTLGKMWSVFIHKWGQDPSAVVEVIRFPPQHHTAIGPNQIMAQERKSLSNTPAPDPMGATPEPNTVLAPPYRVPQTTPFTLFYRMLDAAFLSLNATKPDLTDSCWLCYDAIPPFYEGVALSAQFSYSKESSPSQCLWNTPRKGITLERVSGEGVCVGNQQIVQRNRHICNTSVVLDGTYSWAVPSASGVWACNSTGVTPCISIKDFNEANDFCVQVVIIPRILYHPMTKYFAALRKISHDRNGR